jgi:predicted ATPase
LRTAVSLARLRRDQGRHAEARALLVPVYGWFTEGFDIPHLRRAKALFEELQASDGRSVVMCTTRAAGGMRSENQAVLKKI